MHPRALPHVDCVTCRAPTQVLTPAPGASPASLQFSVTWGLAAVNGSSPLNVTEAFTLDGVGVRVATWLEAAEVPAAFGLVFPALLFDGEHNTTLAVDVARGAASVSLDGWGAQRFEVTAPSGHVLTWSTDAAPTVSRNGLLVGVHCEVSPVVTATPNLTYVLTSLAS